MADNEKATPDIGLPMGQMTGDGNYVNYHMAVNDGTPFNVTDDGDYLHTTQVGRIPIGHMADNGDYVNVYMAPKGRNVMTA